jgi:hypothetical protein
LKVLRHIIYFVGQIITFSTQIIFLIYNVQFAKAPK